jgi:predicted ATP-dependent protease
MVVDAHKLLTQPFSWDGLKRVLRAGEISIEPLGQTLSLIDTVSLDPQPIPLDVKIVLVGERMLYYLLCAYDPDFNELFKVQADFEEDMPRDGDNVDLYARLIGTIVRNEGMRPFDAGAVARVIERAARLARDREKLTTHMRSIADLLHEADYWAETTGHETVAAADVTRAIDAHIRRSDRLRERVQESIAEGGADRQRGDETGPAERLVGGAARRVFLRPAKPDHGACQHGPRPGHRYRARGQAGRPTAFQGRADPFRIPCRPVRAGPPIGPGRKPGLRAVVRRRGR